jgi:hypothetical protein
VYANLKLVPEFIKFNDQVSGFRSFSEDADKLQLWPN